MRKQYKKDLDRKLLKMDYYLALYPLVESLAKHYFTVPMIISYFNEKGIKTYYGNEFTRDNFRNLMDTLGINYRDLKPKIKTVRKKIHRPLDFNKNNKINRMVNESLEEIKNYEQR